MSTNCVKCKELVPAEIKNPYCCESCNNILCKKCTQLCPTEIKVMELTQRKMVFICQDCRSQIKSFHQITEKCLSHERDSKHQETYAKFSEQLLELKTMLMQIEHDNITRIRGLEEFVENENSNQKIFIENNTYSLKQHLERSLNGLKKDMEISVTNILTNECGKKYSGNDCLQFENKPCTNNNNNKSPAAGGSLNTDTSPAATSLKNNNNINKNLTILRQNQREVMDTVINLTSGVSCNVQNINPPSKPHVTERRETQTSGIGEENFVEVKYKRKRREANVGTSTEDSGFEGRVKTENKKLWLFIKRVKDNVSIKQIYDYLRKKTGTQDIQVKKVDTYHKIKDNSCYLIGVDPSLRESIYMSNFWPGGVTFE